MEQEAHFPAEWLRGGRGRPEKRRGSPARERGGTEGRKPESPCGDGNTRPHTDGSVPNWPIFSVPTIRLLAN